MENITIMMLLKPVGKTRVGKPQFSYIRHIYFRQYLYILKIDRNPLSHPITVASRGEAVGVGLARRGLGLGGGVVVPVGGLFEAVGAGGRALGHGAIIA